MLLNSQFTTSSLPKITPGRGLSPKYSPSALGFRGLHMTRGRVLTRGTHRNVFMLVLCLRQSLSLCFCLRNPLTWFPRLAGRYWEAESWRLVPSHSSATGHNSTLPGLYHNLPPQYQVISLLLHFYLDTTAALHLVWLVSHLEPDYRGCTALSYLKLHPTSSKFRTESQDSSSLMTNRWKMAEFCVGGKPQADWTLPRNQVLSHHRHSLKHFPETQTHYPWEL